MTCFYFDKDVLFDFRVPSMPKGEVDGNMLSLMVRENKKALQLVTTMEKSSKGNQKV